ncbi:MAG: pyruvate formate lyase-activating protein [Thermoprotei archaeon]|nr:MAG: pyruvate formate lyase-activating protein [Thermoprotei archaeon]
MERIGLWLIRPDSYTVWSYEEVCKRLSWYKSVMEDRKPAKFIICKHIDAGEKDLKSMSLDELWKLHDELSKVFDELWASIREEEKDLSKIEKPEVSFLHVKVAIAYKLLEKCCFCEHRCGVNRLKGQKGFCRLDKTVYVHSWFHHVGEEAPLVPSGTIFYGSCNFRCVFCQNWDISQENPYAGIVVDAVKLARMQEKLRKTGAKNINHVGGEPTPNLHVILESLLYLEANVPQLWNSNFYCSEETMKLLREVIDIWLPDFKYGNDKCAERLSGVKNYWEIVTRNHKFAHECGDMIIRHLVLPNHIECCTKPILKWIAANTPRALVNIMEQYRPEYIVARYPEKYPDIYRRPYLEEMNRAYKLAEELGIVYEPIS